jgi:hypothetical protein
MARKLFEHVVEKPDTCINRVFAAAVKINSNGDFRLVRTAIHLSGPHDTLLVQA